MNIKNINLIVSGIAIVAQAIALIVLLSTAAFAQITLSNRTVTIQADTMEVREAFRLLNYMVPKSQANFTLKVVKDGKEYIQYRYLINRMLKRYAYTERNGKTKLVRI